MILPILCILLCCYRHNHHEHCSLLVLLDAAAARWNYIVDNLNIVASLIITATDSDTLCFILTGHVYCPINGSLLMQGVQICQPPMVMSFDGSKCGMYHATFLQLSVDGC